MTCTLSVPLVSQRLKVILCLSWSTKVTALSQMCKKNEKKHLSHDVLYYIITLS